MTPTSHGLTVASPIATPTTPMLAPMRLGTAMASCIGAIWFDFARCIRSWNSGESNSRSGTEAETRKVISP